MKENKEESTIVCSPSTVIEKCKNYPLKASLVCISGEQVGYIFALNKKNKIILGSALGIDVYLKGVGVSREHACIKYLDGKYYIEDLVSKNGTYVNGRRIRNIKELDNSDQIIVGSSTVLQFNLSNYLEVNYIDKIRNDLLHDSLTSAYNKRALNEYLKQELAISKLYEKAISLLMIDIDHFKKINDKYGHLAGDRVLKQFGRFLLAYFRERDFVSRYGGEEFLVVCPDTNAANSVKLAENVRKASSINQFEYYDFRLLNLTVSVGVTTFWGEYPVDVQECIRRADKALYVAKNRGRNCISVVF